MGEVPRVHFLEVRKIVKPEGKSFSIYQVNAQRVEIKITGDQKIEEIKTNGRSDADIKEAINEAIKKSQEVAARKLAAQQGGLSGLLGK